MVQVETKFVTMLIQKESRFQMIKQIRVKIPTLILSSYYYPNGFTEDAIDPILERIVFKLKKAGIESVDVSRLKVELENFLIFSTSEVSAKPTPDGRQIEITATRKPATFSMVHPSKNMTLEITLQGSTPRQGVILKYTSLIGLTDPKTEAEKHLENTLSCLFNDENAAIDYMDTLPYFRLSLDELADVVKACLEAELTIDDLATSVGTSKIRETIAELKHI